MPRKRPTETTWDSDEDLLDDDSAITFPFKDDDFDEDALLGGSDDEGTTVSNSYTSVTAEPTFDDHQQESTEFEQTSVTDDHHVVNSEFYGSSHGDYAAIESYSQELNTDQRTTQQNDDDDNDDDDDDEDDDDDGGRRSRFKSERTNVDVKPKATKHSLDAIPDTLEISKEEEEKLDAYLQQQPGKKKWGRHNQRGGPRRGPMGSRAFAGNSQTRPHGFNTPTGGPRGFNQSNRGRPGFAPPSGPQRGFSGASPLGPGVGFNPMMGGPRPLLSFQQRSPFPRGPPEPPRFQRLPTFQPPAFVQDQEQRFLQHMQQQQQREQQQREQQQREQQQREQQQRYMEQQRLAASEHKRQVEQEQIKKQQLLEQQRRQEEQLQLQEQRRLQQIRDAEQQKLIQMQRQQEEQYRQLQQLEAQRRQQQIEEQRRQQQAQEQLRQQQLLQAQKQPVRASVSYINPAVAPPRLDVAPPSSNQKHKILINPHFRGPSTPAFNSGAPTPSAPVRMGSGVPVQQTPPGAVNVSPQNTGFIGQTGLLPLPPASMALPPPNFSSPPNLIHPTSSPYPPAILPNQLDQFTGAPLPVFPGSAPLPRGGSVIEEVGQPIQTIMTGGRQERIPEEPVTQRMRRPFSQQQISVTRPRFQLQQQHQQQHQQQQLQQQQLQQQQLQQQELDEDYSEVSEEQRKLEARARRFAESSQVSTGTAVQQQPQQPRTAIKRLSDSQLSTPTAAKMPRPAMSSMSASRKVVARAATIQQRMVLQKAQLKQRTVIMDPDKTVTNISTPTANYINTAEKPVEQNADVALQRGLEEQKKRREQVLRMKELNRQRQAALRRSSLEQRLITQGLTADQIEEQLNVEAPPPQLSPAVNQTQLGNKISLISPATPTGGARPRFDVRVPGGVISSRQARQVTPRPTLIGQQPQPIRAQNRQQRPMRGVQQNVVRGNFKSQVKQSHMVSIGGLPGMTQEFKIRQLTDKVGPVQNIKMINGTAVVRFQLADHAAEFSNRFNRQMIDLSMISVKLL